MSPLRPIHARLLPAAVSASLITAIVPATQSNADPAPIAAQRDSIAIDGVDGSALRSAPTTPASGTSGDDVVGMTEELDTQDFRVAGVTWEGDRSDVEAFVRTRDAGTGEWTGWSLLEHEEGPDAGSAEGTQERAGTQPLIASASDGIQVRVESPGAKPSGLEVDLVDPGTSPADSDVKPATPADSASSTDGPDAAAAPKPTVNSRADWGADETIRRGDPSYGEVKGAVVHHTAGVNAYTRDEVPGILRGMYDYHVNSLGWDDIGYNVLVDKWGRLWEGRHGGLDQAVIGAQAAGVNSETFGISAMGNYEEVDAPEAMVTSIESFVAWKLDVHGVDATGRAVIGGQEHDTIVGHREVGQTVCPGQYLNARLPDIRTGAKERQD